jgi:leucyl aminopeptidase
MPRNIEVTTRPGDSAETTADTRVVGIIEGQGSGVAAIDELVESGEIKAKHGSSGIAHAPEGRYLAVGLGEVDELTAERSRTAGAAMLSAARGVTARTLCVALPEGADVGAFLEGAILKNYSFDQYKSKQEDDDDGEIASIELVGDGLDEKVRLAEASARAANRARDLQNQPSNVATPSYLADRAAGIAAEHGLEFDIRDREWIEGKGMGAFAAVARGSEEEPRLIELRYEGAGASGPTLGFVGKAVTFDTGGISLKPSAKMEEMKFDMSGGAAVLEATAAIAELGLPVNLITVIPSTENMPSGRATKPGDIVTAYNGKTIEIDNTDAEGRLILADALSYCIELGAERVVNLATLTGAIIVALGSTYAGLFANDDEWAAAVEAAGTATGELGHRLPLHQEYADLIKGKYADISNAPGSRKGSSITAAEFLHNFVGETPWTHLDIAGTAWDLGRSYVGNGASGFGTRLLIELARAHASG